jgi:hypothetical protein
MSSVTARGLLLKHFYQSIGQQVRLEIGTDSTACRGMALRHGVGKVRHLDNKYLWVQEVIKRKMATLKKVGTDDMVADILTKYVEAAVIHKHCATLNLRFVIRGLVGALLTARGDAAGSHKDNVNGGIYGMIGISFTQVQVLMMFMFVLLFFVFLRLVQHVGQRSVRCDRGSVREAVSPAPDEQRSAGADQVAGSSAPAAVDSTELEDSSTGGLRSRTAPGPEAQITGEAMRGNSVRAILSTFTVPQLRECCRVHRLQLGGKKDEMLDRLVATRRLLTESQARELEDLRMIHYRLGLRWPKLELREVASREAAEETLRGLRIACRAREG